MLQVHAVVCLCLFSLVAPSAAETTPSSGDHENAVMAADDALSTLQTKAAAGRAPRSKAPHIVYVLADDLGRPNVGFSAKLIKAKYNEGPFFEADWAGFTPVLNELADTGVVMNRHYAYTSCTPSRGALFSGRLPVHFGTKLGEPYTWDGGVDKNWGYNGIPTNFTTIAAKLKHQGGYKTHLVGKADGLGMATPDHIPTGRGFDSYVGYFNHANDMWDYSIGVAGTAAPPPCKSHPKIYDQYGPGNNSYFLAGTNAETKNPQSSTRKGIYEEDVFLRRSLSIIEQHDPAEPLALFYASHNPHTPLQAPSGMIEQVSTDMCEYNPDCQDKDGACSLITGKEPVGVCRLHEGIKLLAMVQFVDGVVGEIVSALKGKDMWKDTLFVFAGDNGAGAIYSVFGNNYPLKGSKGGIWDGGFRTPALVSGGFLPHAARGTVSEAVMHIADWYATFLSILNIPGFDPRAAEAGLPQPDSVDFWPTISRGHPKDPRNELQLDPNALLWKKSGKWLKFLQNTVSFTMWTGPNFPNSTCSSLVEVARTGCMLGPSNPNSWDAQWPTLCDPVGCLYDVTNDETERHNLNVSHPIVLTQMKERIAKLNIPGSFKGNPGYIQPWQGCEQPAGEAMCNAAVHHWGGSYGPFLNVANCTECIHTTQSYYDECGAGRKTANGEPCVPPTTNECQCYTKLKQCHGDESCQWNFKKRTCELTSEASQTTYAQRIMNQGALALVNSVYK